MTRIFITIPWFLPAYKAGGPIQSVANLVKEFREGVQYFIFTGDTELDGSALQDVVTNEWQPYNDHTLVFYCGPEKISERLVKETERVKPDILFITGLYSWHFNIVPMIYGKAGRKILSTRGMLHPGALSQKKWKKKIYLRMFRLLDYHHRVRFHATDRAEAQFITGFFGKAVEVDVAGNFPNIFPMLASPMKEAGTLSLVTIALISPMKNILLVLEALKTVTAKVQYHIYGPVKDHTYYKECRALCKALPTNITVQWHGEVPPAEVSRALSNGHVFVLPSKSENFGHAFFEALSAGRPVITSNYTPWKKLEVQQAGINVDISTTEELTNAIDFFAGMDQGTYLGWSRSANAFVLAHYDMNKTKMQYDNLFGITNQAVITSNAQGAR